MSAETHRRRTYVDDGGSLVTAFPKKCVALVSLLPPPAGGIASWTENVLRNGLPGGFVPILVDQGYRSGRAVFAGTIDISAELRRTLAILASLVGTIYKYRPVIVHLNCHLSRRGIFRDLLCATVTRIAGVPLLTHYRGNISDFPSGHGYDIPLYALKLLMRCSNVNVTLTVQSIRFARERIAVSTACLLPNFIDDDTLGLHVPASEPGRRRVVYAGGITRAKGAFDIIEIARRIPDAEFVLIGHLGKEECRLLAAPANVTVVGEVARNTLLEMMANSDLLLFPSYSEGFPNTVLEAMALGLPVVATMVGGICDMIEAERGGILKQAGDVDGLTDAVRRLLDQPEKRSSMGRFNREKCRREYAYSVVTPQLVQIYERIMGSRTLLSV